MRTERAAGRRIAAVPIALAAALLGVGCGDDIDPTSSESLGNSTYLTEATSDGVVTLVGGSYDFPPGTGVERIELLTSETGNLDGDDESDAAVVLVEVDGRARLHRLHTVLGDGDRVEDVASRLIGDRVVIENLRVDEGIIEVDMLTRPGNASVEADPSIPVTARFALTDRGLVPINPPEVREGSPRTLGAGASASLVSHEWVLQTISMGDWSQTADALKERPALRFAVELGEAAAGSGSVSGFAGCNRLFGSYLSREGGEIRISGVGATRRACDEDLMSLEQRFLASLAAARSFEVTDDRLEIDFEGGTMTFTAGGELVPPEYPGSVIPRDPTPDTSAGAEADRKT